jgi:hypothetical protein
MIANADVGDTRHHETSENFTVLLSADGLHALGDDVEVCCSTRSWMAPAASISGLCRIWWCCGNGRGHVT